MTVNEGVTLTTVKSDAGYGGPKGMYLCVNGTITNNGTISMTARGAKAKGQNVYLWQNASGDYEYIPAIGGSGGKNTTLFIATEWGSEYNVFYNRIEFLPGKNASEKRALAGGAAGGFYIEGKVSGRIQGYVGNGGDATSYSGGSGGGAVIYVNQTATSTTTYTGDSGKENGGAGGNRYAVDDNLNGSNGTGGLLIIFGKSVINDGMISSDGSDYNTVVGDENVHNQIFNGGASGAGSINIFYVNSVERGNISALGGSQSNSGRKGGNGSISVGKIVDGTYVE